MTAIDKLKGSCAGCFACYNVCPERAIEMKLSSEGFYVPYVNEKCNNCGLCEKVCPVLYAPKIERYKVPICYAAWSMNEEIRMKSSSGGVFSELAIDFLRRDGVVYGVVWGKNCVPVHYRATDEEALEKMRGSKYVPSYVGNSYREALNDLEKGNDVLFSGTPCQIAALNKLIELLNVDDSRLCTIDVVCHGVPSLAVFHKYLKYAFGGKKIKSINFRDKELGWSNYQVKVEFEDGSFYSSRYSNNPFYAGYLLNLYLNNICYACPFSKVPRQGDLTLGDFWGAPENLKNEKGVSVVLVNSEKGERILKNLKGIKAFEVPLETATKSNPRIISGNLKKPKSRSKALKANNFKEVAKIIRLEKYKMKALHLIKIPYYAIRRLRR